MSVNDHHERRRSRVSDAVSDSGPGSIYDDPTDRDSLDRESVPPLPVKPPTNIKIDPHQAGNSADEYFNDMVTTPSDETPTSQAIERRRTSSHGLSHTNSPSHGRSSRRTRSRSTARDLIRMLVSAEDRDSREALALLRRTSERLELESQRANEAERRVQEANDRWRLINQARLQAQTEASRINEELRLYKLQLETAQSQIARANDMISQTDKEKAFAEDEAAKARRLAKRYEMESMIQKAREEGRRLGREQGLKEGREFGQYEGLRMYENRAYPDRDGYDDRTYVEEDPYDEREEEMPPVQRDPTPVQPQDISMQERQQMFRSAPDAVPAQARSIPKSTTSRGPRRQDGFLSSISRFKSRRGSGMDRNVEINPSNAPDVATIIDDEPLHTVTSPLPPERTSQVNHTTPTRMPVPNFNPDPSEVRPISMPNRPRSPMHPPTVIPPDGYIPRQDNDGSIRLPPPHDFQQAPPTPRSYNSPLPNSANLPPPAATELPQREPIGRDFGYTGGQQPRPHGNHRYQKSVAESDDTVATTALSIISPPGPGRPSASQSRLSAIPEYDGRYASPSGSMRQGDGAVYPASPRSRSSRRADESGAYPTGDFAMDPKFANRQSMASEGPVRPMDMGATFSPRSVRSGYSGPRRPSHLSTPAPLAPDGYGQPAYTRPRINSVASSAGFGDIPRPSRSQERTPGPEYSRSRPVTAANSAIGDPPEINIVPASRSESLQSRTTNMPQEAMSPRMSPYSHRMDATPDPPAPVTIPGMPKGFVPTTPVASSNGNLPKGFVPTTPTVPGGAPLVFAPVSAPVGAPPGFVPTSPAAPHSPAVPAGAPLGFVPISPAAPPGAPPGFVPTSPAAPPGAPPGFIPTTPTIPGAPPGFVPVSPVAPEGAPPGFLPTSTTFPVNPLPQPNPTLSPSMSVTGALPVLVRSTSEKSAAYFNPTGTTTPRSVRVSFSGPNAGFNSRAASEWDTRSAWGDNRSDYSPRPVRGPDLYSYPASPRAADIRPGSSMSRRDSSPVIPDPAAFQASHPTSLRRSSRVSFGGDPTSVPLPASMAPSLARSGRASSHGSVRTENRTQTQGPGISRSASARSGSRAPVYPYAAPGGMPTPGAPAHPSLAGMPPAGLESPYSRRLDPHPEDEAENEIVPSDDSSTYTLTTPPAQRRDPPGGTPSMSARNSRYTHSPTGSQRRVSLFVPPDPADNPERVAQRPLEYSERDPSLRRSASRQSVGSNRSYARFDPTDYVDPAVLTSGRSRLLDLPQVESAVQAAPSKGKKGKAKKGKGKGR